MSKGAYIVLASGAKAYVSDPNNVSIEDIAKALSQLCRFTGHTRPFYSVAQHSVMVARSLPKELQLTGLLHDASEAVLGDISSPLKGCLDEYRKLQEIWETAIAKQYGTVHPLPLIVKNADRMALATEKRDLMPPSDEVGPIIKDVPAAPDPIYALTPAEAEEEFLEYFRERYVPF